MINRLLILGLLAAVGKEVYEIYKVCQPELAKEGEKGVAWDLLQAGALDICIYLGTTERPPPQALGLEPSGASTASSHVLVGEFKGVVPAEDVVTADLAARLELPKAMRSNGTLYLHVLALPPGRSSSALRHKVVRISRHQVPAEERFLKRNLLEEPTPPEGPPPPPPRPVSSLPRVVEVGFIRELRRLDRAGLKKQGLGQYVAKGGGEVKLPLYVNTLVSPRDEYVPVVDSADAPAPLDMEVRFRNIGLAYWNLQMQISNSFDDAEKTYGLNEYDVDSFKQMIGGSSPIKILLVYGVAIVHLIFEYLAFASDISFWRQKTSFEGLSSTSVALQAGTNIVMALYIREQQQTKFVMYFVAFRFCLQLWKLQKLTTLESCKEFPYVRWVNRSGAETGLEELAEAQEAERRCMRWLMCLLLPVVLAFSVHRLRTQKFRSWYSWVILSLAVCVQAGGFVVMTPQVFLNYRLKSVEHLPWNALTYQAINTFIDDIFALCIRMPEIQKYSVFRDDIIFAICCFQRWLYRKPQPGGQGAPADGGADAAQGGESAAAAAGEGEKPKDQ